VNEVAAAVPAVSKTTAGLTSFTTIPASLSWEASSTCRKRLKQNFDVNPKTAFLTYAACYFGDGRRRGDSIINMRRRKATRMAAAATP